MKKRNDRQIERLVRFAEMCYDYAMTDNTNNVSRHALDIFHKVMVQGKLMSDVATEENMTRERVRQIIEKTMRVIASAAYMQKCKIKRLVEEL